MTSARVRRRAATNVLASDASDPAFSPEEPSQEALSLLTATVDEDIERIFVRLPQDERLAPIAGRGQDVRERLAARAQIGMTGRVIRTHGDYRDSTTLVEAVPDGWWYTTPVPGRRRVAAYLTDADLLPPRTARTTRDWSERLALAPHTANALASAGLSLTHAPLLTDASVAYLDPLTGPGWTAAGDAAVSFDPLSSQGILTALLTGREAGQAAAAILTNADPEPLLRYSSNYATLLETHMRTRAAYYTLEQRWPDTPFWTRRHALTNALTSAPPSHNRS